MNNYESAAGKTGIAGWLFWLSVFLGIYVIRGIVELINLSIYAPYLIGRNGPLQMYLLIFSIVSLALCCYIGIKAIIAMITHHSSFKFLFIFYSVAPLFFGSILIFLVPLILHVDPISSEVALVFNAAFAVVWVPYVVSSRRVEDTFIETGSLRGVGETMIRHLGMPRFLVFFIALTLLGSVAFGWMHKPLWLLVPPVILLVAAFRTSSYTAARMEEVGISTRELWGGVIGPNILFAVRNTLIDAVIFCVFWLVAGWV